MNEIDLEKLLSGQAKRPLRRWRCLDDMQIAGFVDGLLDEILRQSVEAHVADCAYCRGQVSFLVQSAAWEEPGYVPLQLLSKAKNLVNAKPRSLIGWDWRWATALATCLLFAVAMFFAWRVRRAEPQPAIPSVAQQGGAQPAAIPQPSSFVRNPDVIASANSGSTSKTGPPKAEPSVPIVRKSGALGGVPQLIFPSDGAILKRNKMQFRWQAVADALFYEVSIMTAAGDTLITRQTETPQMQLSSAGQLISGEKYFVSVRARLREGKTMRSSVISFRISD